MNDRLLQSVLDALNDRRFILALGAGIVTSILCAFGKISGDVYSVVTIATVAAYITGHAYQAVKGGSSDQPPSA